MMFDLRLICACYTKRHRTLKSLSKHKLSATGNEGIGTLIRNFTAANCSENRIHTCQFYFSKKAKESKGYLDLLVSQCTKS